MKNLIAKIILVVALIGGFSQCAQAASKSNIYYLKFNTATKTVSSFCLKAPGKSWKSPQAFVKRWSKHIRAIVNPNNKSMWIRGVQGGIAQSSKRACLAAIEVVKSKGYKVGR